MRKYESIIGKQFNRLTVLSEDKLVGKQRYFNCKCECGNITSVRMSRLKNKNKPAISCGKCKDSIMEIKLVGKKFGMLTILSLDFNSPMSGIRGGPPRRVICKCECGTIKSIPLYYLKDTKSPTLSCGCYRDFIKTSHGMSKTRIYSIWQGMRDRCNNPKNVSYPNYGGRGISYLDKWEDFEEFYRDMGDPPTDKHELDRIDNDKHYTKKNCRWSTHKEQQNNKRNSHFIEFNGKKQTLTQWSEETGIKKETLRYRLYNNWPLEKALS